MLTVREMCDRLGISGDAGEETRVHMLMREAEEYARQYCRLREGEEVPAFLLTKMVTEDYGRANGAGVQSRSLGGASEQYRGEYSADVMAILRAMRHIGAVKTEVIQ